MFVGMDYLVTTLEQLMLVFFCNPLIMFDRETKNPTTVWPCLQSGWFPYL